MSENTGNNKENDSFASYNLIKGRLIEKAGELKTKLDKLNKERLSIFGESENILYKSETILTENDCVPRDILAIGNTVILGYNIQFGLKNVVDIKDIFSIYEYKNGKFNWLSNTFIGDKKFQEDFAELFKYYKNTFFSKFYKKDGIVHMIFHTSTDGTDIKSFKWIIKKDNTLEYVGNRFASEVKFPQQQEFKWTKTVREQQISGQFPHISIEDRIFVEAIGGDLTIKIENNTNSGKGIYVEEVENKNQTLDDAEIYYSFIGNLILLKIKPYQEKDFRYLIYNDKTKSVNRVDSIGNTAVLLPEEHGLIFPDGIYLQSGEFKKFDISSEGVLFQNRKIFPNGEDFQYIFYKPATGEYYIYTYNIISQDVDTPISCHGYSRFANGEMIVFKTDNEPKKNHIIQIWKTAFKFDEGLAKIESDKYLFSIGNKDIVKLMSDCSLLYNILRKDDTYYRLYIDIVHNADTIIKNYFWIDREEAFFIDKTLLEIKEIGTTAIKEYEKVSKIRNNTTKQFEIVKEKTEKLIKEASYHTFETINDYVRFLTDLRKARSETSELKELQFIDLKEVEKLSQSIKERTTKLSEDSITFLLRDNALAPYILKVDDIEKQLPLIKKAIDGKTLNDEVTKVSEELELLINIVSSLKIDDSTKTAEIMDKISILFSRLNQIKSKIKSITNELDTKEMEVEFYSKLNLITNAVSNYIEISDTSEKIEGYITKLTVQIDELESRFSEFTNFVNILVDKREEIISAFESKKQQIADQRNRKINALVSGAERIFKGMQNRLQGVTEISEINDIFSTDTMTEKIIDMLEKLIELGDASKAGEIEKKLKTLKENAIKQLKDKKELFDKDNTIRLGNKNFYVNTQKLELSFMKKEEHFYLFISSTDFWERVNDPEIGNYRAVWNQEIVSENESVYRGEYLAYKIYKSLHDSNHETTLDINEELIKEKIKSYVESNYNEYYIKGVSDTDGVNILKAIIDTKKEAELAIYSPAARAAASLFWHIGIDESIRETMKRRVKSANIISNYTKKSMITGFVPVIADMISQFLSKNRWISNVTPEEVAEYLAKEMSKNDSFILSLDGKKIYNDFTQYLISIGAKGDFANSVSSVKDDIEGKYILICEWIKAFLEYSNQKRDDYFYELMAILFVDDYSKRRVAKKDTLIYVENILGIHNNINSGIYTTTIVDFFKKMSDFSNTTESFVKFQELKSKLIREAKERYKFDELTPKILPSFVRNRLIDRVYLPLIGDNLAKQIGVAGSKQRTDNMGMLLLISPPGYGKTTLVEYVSSRLNMILVKINCPTLGNKITSLDPDQADNINTREELKKLNFAFELGNNVMIYLDDIQHSNPEFLQKFISLCDGQRKIDGVYNGQGKTYSFRGKKVAIVMAGNPYTESGEKFKIPDMLSNRSDVYNLGDMMHENEEAFKLSYIENAITSNNYLNSIYSKNPEDIYKIIEYINGGEKGAIDIGGNHSENEINDAVSVLRILMKIREEILTVNREYIYSASQNIEYRTEPPFKLQGSYRNMNKIAEKVLPIMNEVEVDKLIENSYVNDAQTLAGEAEASLLKFKEITNRLDEKSAERWNEIKGIFMKNNNRREGDKITLVIQELKGIAESIKGMQKS